MNTTTLISLGITAAAIAGCAATTPNWDEHFGETVAAAKLQQTKNAAAQHSAPDGVDGATAKATVDAYQRSFSAPVPAANVLSIGIGSGPAQP